MKRDPPQSQHPAMQGISIHFMCTGTQECDRTEKKSRVNSGTPFVATSSEKDFPFLLYELPIGVTNSSSAYGNLMWINRTRVKHHPAFGNNSDKTI